MQEKSHYEILKLQNLKRAIHSCLKRKLRSSFAILKQEALLALSQKQGLTLKNIRSGESINSQATSHRDLEAMAKKQSSSRLSLSQPHNLN
jgi:hypothetical protein